MISTLRRKGYEIHTASEPEQALGVLNRTPIDVVVMDSKLAGMEELFVMKQVKTLSPQTEIVLVLTEGNVETALKSIKAGAYDYLTTPFRPDELNYTVGRALEKKRLSDRVRVLEEETCFQKLTENIVGTSRAMTDVLKVVRQVARLDSTVLVSGENGTGKELIARTLHSLSPRKNMPYVVVSCSAIPEDLQEAELFGHTKGGAGGAKTTKRGLFEEAHGGTVFLEEVVDLSASAQTSMLRFLQNGQVTKVGTTVGRSLDVRVIAAANRDLEKSVEDKTFIEDLFYRLNVVPIHIPPLRDRPEDIPLLAQRFIERSAAKIGIHPAPSISARVNNLFVAQPWRGNVRELECTIERAVALDRDGVIGMDDVPLGESQRSEDKVLDRARKNSLTLSKLEREYILEVLSECGGSRKKTAERLGITTATLWRKLKQYEQEG
jgi:DNA-binding NtrC family response regulator